MTTHAIGSKGVEGAGVSIWLPAARRATTNGARDGISLLQPSGVDSGYAWFRLFLSVIVGTTACVGTWSVVVVLPTIQVEFQQRP